MTKHPTIEIVDGTNGRAMYITIDGYMFYIDNTTDEQIMECWRDDGTDGRYWKKVGVRAKWDSEHRTDEHGMVYGKEVKE